MSLSVDSRSCGKAYVLRLIGRIVAGDESRTLETALTRCLQDSNRVVLNVGEVSRVDSSGMGLLVRFLCRIRSNGGDLRLAAPQGFFCTLLGMTKLLSIFRTYGTEDEAIVSFLKEPGGARESTPAGPLVLFLDQSPDLCAFVRKVLNGHGYEAITTLRLHDAKLLLSAADVAFLVLGPEPSQLPVTGVLAALQPLARNAKLIQLDHDFEIDDAEKAASQLVRKIQADSVSP